LRTGHIPLHKHLHTIGKEESPICPTCHGAPEDVHHFLMRCPTYDDARNRLRTAIGRDANKINAILTNRANMGELFNFIESTGRFKGTYG
ncbi:hypothetical protein OF83DRAFT_1047402, partial [Amylostereum chailletii]